MQQIDIEFLSSNISSLCGIPIRIYKDNKYVFFYSVIDLIKDPITIVENEILSKNEKIGYITTNDFFFYTYINYLEYKIVIGPFRLVKADDNVLSMMAFKLGLPNDDIQQFASSMKSFQPTSLEIIIQTACTLYFVLTNEKIMIKDILIDDDKITRITQDVNRKIKEAEIDEDDSSYINNTLSIERELYHIIEYGEIEKLKGWIKSAPPIHPGTLSNDTLRHTKNTFIVATALASRAAIKGNMDPMQALALSDLYIQKMELLQKGSDIYSLQTNMILDYTERIAKIKSKDNASILLINLNKYILNHLSDAIKSDDLCDALYISKSSLFSKIKNETGMTLSNYILSVKIKESKDLLKYTDRSIGSISAYLGFSSQSHFNHAFKLFMKTTPLEYRKHH